MPSAHDPDAFRHRVSYAAWCLTRGTRASAHFDACFAMADGDVVVTALVRRADRNPDLASAIAARCGGRFPADWRKAAERYTHLGCHALPDAAREERDRWSAAPAEPTKADDRAPFAHR
jgi:hypothetical protein